MSDIRPFDCKPPRRDESTTRASAHPELISGDLIMHPRMQTLLSAEDRAAVSVWTRRMVGFWAAVAVALVSYSSIGQHSESNMQLAAKEEPMLSPTCRQWHETASLAAARLVESTRDADLRQANDAIFRLRRARRNCEQGWVTLACHDYHAVAHGAPGRSGMIDEPLFSCERAPGTGHAQSTSRTGTVR